MLKINKFTKLLLCVLNVLIITVIGISFVSAYQYNKENTIETGFIILKEDLVGANNYYVVSVLIPRMNEDNYRNIVETTLDTIAEDCKGFCDYSFYDHKRAFNLWDDNKSDLNQEEKDFVAKHNIASKLYDVVNTTYYPQSQQPRL